MNRQRSETLKELLAYQRECGLGDVHLVSLRYDGFDVAHTDAERATGDDLEDCPVHRWLMSFSGPPEPPGTYRVIGGTTRLAPYGLESQK